MTITTIGYATELTNRLRLFNCLGFQGNWLGLLLSFIDHMIRQNFTTSHCRLLVRGFNYWIRLILDDLALLWDRNYSLFLHDGNFGGRWSLDRFEIMGCGDIDDLLNNRLIDSFYHRFSININNLFDDRLKNLLDHGFLRLYLANQGINFIERLLNLCNEAVNV